MKITTGQFNDSYFPVMDGVAMATHNYALGLNSKYGKSMVIAPKANDYQDQVPYKVNRFRTALLPGLNPFSSGLPFIDIKFKNKIREVPFDLVHAHSPYISGHLAQEFSKKLSIPLVTTFYSRYSDDLTKAINNELIIDFLKRFTLDFYNSADLVWVPDKATGLTLKNYGYKGPYELMPDGTDMAVPGKLKGIEYRKKGLKMIEAGTDDFVLLYVGQHRWEKNIRLIIDSLKRLKEKGKSFKMVFVGEGYAAGDMLKLVKKYNLQDYVVFKGVITDRKQLRYVYAASDLFLFPSVYDNPPLVTQEAAAFDIPSVVVANTPSAGSIIDGVNGFLIENEAGDLTRKIVALMKNQHAIKKAGEGARRSLYHPWESIMEDVYYRYTELIKSHKYPIQGK